MTTLYATFDGQVLRPDEPIALPPNTRVRLQLEPAGTNAAARQGSRKPATDAEKQAARERFERHFGEVDLGSATGVDNGQIDADLARAYEGADSASFLATAQSMDLEGPADWSARLEDHLYRDGRERVK